MPQHLNMPLIYETAGCKVLWCWECKIILNGRVDYSTRGRTLHLSSCKASGARRYHHYPGFKSAPKPSDGDPRYVRGWDRDEGFIGTGREHDERTTTEEKDLFWDHGITVADTANEAPSQGHDGAENELPGSPVASPNDGVLYAEPREEVDPSTETPVEDDDESSQTGLASTADSSPTSGDDTSDDDQALAEPLGSGNDAPRRRSLSPIDATNTFKSDNASIETSLPEPDSSADEDELESTTSAEILSTANTSTVRRSRRRMQRPDFFSRISTLLASRKRLLVKSYS